MRATKAPEVLFWSKVKKTRGCWVWTATKTHNGYGTFVIRNRATNQKEPWRAHRFSFRLHFGSFDPSFHVLHKCDNPACVRPDHLFLGTNHENRLDSKKKGRTKNGATGQTHCYRWHPLFGPNCRISPKGVRICRECARLYREANRERLRLYQRHYMRVRRGAARERQEAPRSLNRV